MKEPKFKVGGDTVEQMYQDCAPMPGFWEQQRELAKEPVDLTALLRSLDVEPCWRCGATYDRMTGQHVGHVNGKCRNKLLRQQEDDLS